MGSQPSFVLPVVVTGQQTVEIFSIFDSTMSLSKHCLIFSKRRQEIKRFSCRLLDYKKLNVLNYISKADIIKFSIITRHNSGHLEKMTPE